MRSNYLRTNSFSANFPVPIRKQRWLIFSFATFFPAARRRKEKKRNALLCIHHPHIICLRKNAAPFSSTNEFSGWTPPGPQREKEGGRGLRKFPHLRCPRSFCRPPPPNPLLSHRKKISADEPKFIPSSSFPVNSDF